MSSILITGAARGIGRAVALSLAATGWEVYAGVRRLEDGESLASQAPAGRLLPVLLDVTDQGQISTLADSLPQRLDAVLNNAGIVVDGPIEAVTPEDLRRQLEVNVVGRVAVTQAVLPLIRQSAGRVVFISSVSGRISTPWTGVYSASKFALEQLDATESALSQCHRRLYAGHLAGMRRTTKLIQNQAVPVDRVVAAVERALNDTRPKARYPVGLTSRLQLLLNAATPTSLWDASLARLTGVPRRPPAQSGQFARAGETEA